MEAAVVSIYCFSAWKAGWTKAPASAPFWRVLFLSYEVMEYEMKDLECIEVSISESDSSEAKEEVNAEGSILTTYFNLSSWTGASSEAEKSQQKHVSQGHLV